MLSPIVLEQIQRASISERLQLVELIVASLKGELSKTTTQTSKPARRFVVRTFSLGQDVQVNRDILYTERG